MGRDCVTLIVRKPIVVKNARKWIEKHLTVTDCEPLLSMGKPEEALVADTDPQNKEK